MFDYHPQISASILSADFAILGKEISSVISAGASRIHLDVMDNHYVPNLTIGPTLCKSLLPYIEVPLDIHLMVSCADDLILACQDLKAASICIHRESTRHLDRSFNLIRDQGAQVGLALNPLDSLDSLEETLPILDTVLIMSVNPGFGGQKFIPYIEDKIKRVANLCHSYEKKWGRKISIQVDGGINLDNIASVSKVGAEIFIMGSSIFHSSNYRDTISQAFRIVEDLR